MKIRYPILRCLFVSLFAVSCLTAQTRTVDFAGKRAMRVEGKRVGKSIWSTSQKTSLMDKSFPIEKWDSHFSSVGSKRAAIAVKEKKDKQMFKTKQLDSMDKVKSFKMARINQQMVDLHKKAGVSIDEKAQIAADQQFYYMMLQDSQKYSDMAKQASLRDINRYQFRRNRTDDGVPVKKAGSGE